MKTKSVSVNLDVTEKRIDLSETEFEQSFEIYSSSLYCGTLVLVYGSPDGETVIKEYEFEIDVDAK